MKMADGYRPRLADARLRELLANFSVVMIHGPRATGKTTTAEQLAASTVRLDKPAQAAAFRADPDAALVAFDEPVLLDEWQEAPEVLGAVKRAVDRDNRPGRFLLTGSVRADLQAQMWPATGRAIRMRMYGFTERELVDSVGGQQPSFFDRLATASPRSFKLPKEVPDLVGYIDLALRSAFPEIVLAERSEPMRRIWLDSYLDQLLTGDATRLQQVRDPAKLRRYFEALALNTAGLVAHNTIYDMVQTNAKTASAYEQLLVNLFVLEQMPAWSTSRLRRLVKRTKAYVIDAGLAASGAGLTTRAVLRDGDLLGRTLDTFAVAQLRPEAALSAQRCRMYHLRLEGGRHEIDVVVEREAGEVLGIEIKASAAPSAKDAKHLAWMRDELGDRFVAGAILHTGSELYQLSERVLALPICAIWG